MTDAISRPANAVTVHEPYGFIAIKEWAGDELDIVNAARVSHAKESSMVSELGVGGKLSEADAGLINFLLKGRHGTPFEMVWTKWHISAPIFVFREWHRHRLASVNEVSGRYVQLEPRFYLPDDEHVRVQVGKPGHYTYEAAGSEWCHTFDKRMEASTYGNETRKALSDAYHQAYAAYETMLDRGIAKEIARACLPVATYSEMYWACNLRALLNFLSLRNEPRALQEIRDYAAIMEDMLKQRMPTVHAAFEANGRVAP